MANNIYSLLQEGKLVEAFPMLETKLSSLENWPLQDELHEVEHTYNTMLSYFVQGIEDPEREKMHTRIIQTSYSINDRANILIRLKKNPTDKYCLTYSSYFANPTSFEDIHQKLKSCCSQLKELKDNPFKRESIQSRALLDAIKEHEATTDLMFNTIWTSQLWNKNDFEICSDIMSDEEIMDEDKALMISGLMLSLLELFDEQKMMLLFDAYLDGNNEISMRALTSLVLLVIRYDSRLPHYPQINSRLKLYCENEEFVRDCYSVLMQLQYSKLTDQVSYKMTNDIMPAILKSAKFKQTDMGIQEIDEALTKHGENPEWHRSRKDEAEIDQKAEKKMRKMTDMQIEGADVYMGTFRHLKSFSFFNTISHWFVPFSMYHEDLMNTFDKMRPEVQRTFNSLLKMSPFCDSDKYSFIFMMEGIGDSIQDSIANQINSQMAENDMNDFFENIKKHKQSNDLVIRFYIYDLYRFFNAYTYHNQFFDPFSKQLRNFSPIYTKALSPLLNSREHILALAEFMMRKEMYRDAINLYMYLDPKEVEEDADIWQKIGFCQQKEGVRQAWDSYLIADKLQPNSQWTILHLAQVAFYMNKFDIALTYYDRLLDIDEENVKWLSKKAECLFGLDKYEESLPVLYKLAYLEEETEHSIEMLAWGLLMTDNMEKAEKEYKCLDSQWHSAKNSINIAQFYLVNNDIKQAHGHYLEAYNQEKSVLDFKEKFWDCAPYLYKRGVDKNKMQMMYDAIVNQEGGQS